MVAVSRPGKFTREELLETARTIGNREGWQNLTLARLAEELDIQSPSLYKHVKGIEGLRAALAAHLLALLVEALEAAVRGTSGHDSLLALAQGYRQFVLGNPGMVSAIAAAPDRHAPGVASLDDRILALGLKVFHDLGFEGQDAVHGLRSLRSLAHGFAVLELEAGFGRPEQVNRSFEWALEHFIRGL